MTREDRAVADEPETDDERRGPAAERMPNEKHDGSTPLFARDDAERYRSRWQDVRSGKMSTEDMRVALQRYRSFFDRLLSV
ncbi:MAG TPA: hypothetical protein VF998_12020 [Candidatus Limnocylindria bacterium]